MVVGSGKVTAGSSWHPAVTRRGEQPQRELRWFCWKTTLASQSKANHPPHPPAVLSPRGGFTVLGGVSRSCYQEGRSQGGGALVAAAGRRVEGGRPGGKGTVGSGDRAALEDSGLILGAEAPLRVWLWVHDPGNTSVGRGLLVRIRWFQLPNKERAGGSGLKVGPLHQDSIPAPL